MFAQGYGAAIQCRWKADVGVAAQSVCAQHAVRLAVPFILFSCLKYAFMHHKGWDTFRPSLGQGIRHSCSVCHGSWVCLLSLQAKTCYRCTLGPSPTDKTNWVCIALVSMQGCMFCVGCTQHALSTHVRWLGVLVCCRSVGDVCSKRVLSLMLCCKRKGVCVVHGC